MATVWPEAEDGGYDVDESVVQPTRSPFPLLPLPVALPFCRSTVTRITGKNVAGVEHREPGSSLVTRLRKDGTLPYLIEEGREGEFIRIYDAQTQLLSQERPYEAAVFIARYWLDQCWNTHSEEHPRTRADWHTARPQRLIDLDNIYRRDSYMPQTIKVADVQAADERQYIAISYRWPQNLPEDHQLTLTTRDEFYAGYITHKLPSVYRDAMKVTAMLGFRYMWLDALCIMQGPGGDWDLEAPKMASIYENAVMTVAFGGQSCSPSCREHGLDHTCHGRREGHHLETAVLRSAAKPFIRNAPITEFAKKSPESILAWLDASGNFPTRRKNELETRGWTFQERLLSRRVLTIDDNGFFWDCGCMNAEDSRPLGLRGDFSPKFRDSDERQVKSLLLGSQDDASQDSDRFYYTWRQIARGYTRRSFTRYMDRMMAIRGVVTVMETALQDRCFLGIWKKDALRQMAWFCETHLHELSLSWWEKSSWTPKDRSSLEKASWSWTSVSEPVEYRLWHPFQTHSEYALEHVSPCAELKHIQMDAFDSQKERDLRGSSYHGTMTIYGCVAEVPLMRMREHFCKVILDPRPWEEFPLGFDLNDEQKVREHFGANSPTGRYHAQPRTFSWQDILTPKRMAVIPNTVEILPLFRGGYNKTLQALYCLILCPVRAASPLGMEGPRLHTGDGSHIFRRLGLLVIDEASRDFPLGTPNTCKDPRCVERAKLLGSNTRQRQLCYIGEPQTIAII